MVSDNVKPLTRDQMTVLIEHFHGCANEERRLISVAYHERRELGSPTDETERQISDAQRDRREARFKLDEAVDLLLDDRERLDWLEGEGEREAKQQHQSAIFPPSLFRQNRAITRAAIDYARGVVPARSGRDSDSREKA